MKFACGTNTKKKQHWFRFQFLIRTFLFHEYEISLLFAILLGIGWIIERYAQKNIIIENHFNTHFDYNKSKNQFQYRFSSGSMLMQLISYNIDERCNLLANYNTQNLSILAHKSAFICSNAKNCSSWVVFECFSFGLPGLMAQ